MIISATLLTAALVVKTYSLATVLWVSGGTLGVGGPLIGTGVYFWARKPLNGKDAADLATFRAEEAARDQLLQMEASSLVRTAVASAEKIESIVTMVHQEIDESTQQLNEEVERIEEPNAQLAEIVSLLQEVGQSTSTSAETLITEIKSRLNELTETNLQLERTCERLNAIAARFEAVTNEPQTRHVHEDIASLLTLQLNDATRDRDALALQSQNLMALNNELLKKIRELGLVLQERQERLTPSPTFFGRNG